MMQPIDEAVRRRARTASVNVLVEAGAGTGKTTLLVDRVIHGLTIQNIPLTRMLLITFMDKAQMEMRERLHQRLRSLLPDAQGEALRRIEAALRDLPHAHVTTIHGFCHRVLQEYGIDFGIPLGFRVLDAVETERLWDQTFRHWVTQPQFEERVLRLLEAGLEFRHLYQWARDMSNWGHWPAVEGEMPDLDEFVRTYAIQAEQFYHRAQESATPQDRGRSQIARIHQEFHLLQETDRVEWPRMLARWTRGLSPQGNKKGWNPPEGLTEQKEWVLGLKERLGQLRQQMADAYLKEWLDLLKGAFLPYWRQKRFEESTLTFDDLLQETYRVTENPTVWQALSRRYDVVMVDEFQDTDAIQAAIIKRLVTPVESRGLTVQDQGRLFLVGDPKQSIYRFRGADVETYAAIREEVRQTGGEVLPIWQNFRSHPAILRFVNGLFESQWPEKPDSERPYIPPYQPLMSLFDEDTRERVAVQKVGEGHLAAVIRRREAEAIAQVIQRAVSEQWPVREATSQMRPIGYGDIALIVPQRTGLELYRQVLRDYGIPVASQMGRAFFHQDEIRGIRHLFQALYDPADGSAIAGWLLSPWVALSYQQLAEHRAQGGTWDIVNPGTDGLPQVVQRLRQLGEWHHHFWTVDAETVLDWAVAHTALIAALRTRGDQAALANVARLRDFCRRLGDRWDLFEFTRWLNDQVRTGAPLEEAEIQGDGARVAISTVHQAKGLEWPMVIVANWKAKDTNLGSGVYRNARMGWVGLHQEPWTSREYPAIEAYHRLREEAEGARLLYVALTRAKDYLWFYTSFLDEALVAN